MPCCAASATRRCSSRVFSATGSPASSSTSTTTSTWAARLTAACSDDVRGTRQGRAFGAVFAELAAKFGDFVDVLAEIRDSGKAAAIDVLRLYEIRRRTGSRRAPRACSASTGSSRNATLNVATRH